MDRGDLVPGVRYDIAGLCELLSEPTRVAMALELMDGRARPAGELARAARVSAQTASAHFGKLVAGGVFAVEQQGRHRYYRIASDAMAHAIEALGVAHPQRPGPPAERGPLQRARTCYRHLAGSLGVALRERMELDGLLSRDPAGYVLTASGVGRLAEFLGAEGQKSALLGRACLDWTERRHHVGGPLGNALARGAFDAGWLQRAVDGRAVHVTTRGERGFRSLFGLSLSPERSLGPDPVRTRD